MRRGEARADPRGVPGALRDRYGVGASSAMAPAHPYADSYADTYSYADAIAWWDRGSSRNRRYDVRYGRNR
jgi:hypothetical protein